MEEDRRTIRDFRLDGDDTAHANGHASGELSKDTVAAVAGSLPLPSPVASVG